MKVITFTPYASLSYESGVIYLLANYLRAIYPEMAQLKCNGLFSICSRDGECNWKRHITSCLECAGEQQKLATWSGMSTQLLSNYLTVADVEETRKWVYALKMEDLLTAKFKDEELSPFVRYFFKERFGEDSCDLNNKNHLRVVYNILLIAARMLVATDSFIKVNSPEYAFIPSCQDTLSAVFAKRANLSGVKVIVFKWSMQTREMLISHYGSEKVYPCSLLLEDITSMRRDPSTWPRELIAVIGDILGFLGLADKQLTLPLS